MQLKDMIEKRRSVRAYADTPVEPALLEQICGFMEQAKPLYPGIGTYMEIVSKEQVRFYFPWKAPQLLAVYSENKPGYLENVGFLFQQMDLFLQSLGLGACWLGLGKLREKTCPEGMEFVILLAFGHPKGESRRSGAAQFRRKSLSQIADKPDPRLEPARLAPSSTNSQPWYFLQEGDRFHAYCSAAGERKHKALGTMNRIDMGISLAHLYAANPGSFRFFKEEYPEEVPGHSYIGSFKL